MLPIRLPATELARLHRASAPGVQWQIDLQAQCITLPDGALLAFEVDPMRRGALLDGLDDIGRTLRLRAGIDAWQARDRLARPWIWATGPSVATTP